MVEGGPPYVFASRESYERFMRGEYDVPLSGEARRRAAQAKIDIAFGDCPIRIVGCRFGAPLPYFWLGADAEKV